ncbi:hypothetical protein BY458DRAFT_528214 [Sporodiniella umbellata]|nr:hypothetical protein BY458DRAFT_528214 [Sporodiniella umbellata]
MHPHQNDMTESRFSVNSNLMNYSIPTGHKNDKRREIKQGDSNTRSRQFEAQIEQLTLQNVKLQRTNRLLKVDTDNLIEQHTSPLEKVIEELTVSNVRLQRNTRLLQQELDEKMLQLNELKEKQIMQMKSVGPEYEFLVQNINLLQRQIAGHPICESTCCFTMKPIDQSNMIMTLPATENEDEGLEAQHICRPIIHSNISQGSYATELEHKVIRLEKIIQEQDQEKEEFLRQQSYKDNDFEMLKKELRVKDEIVSQLEQDFMCLEDQLEHLQKELEKQNSPRHSPTQDPKKQSQLLMESKRRSLAVKDMHLLEQMLRGDLDTRYADSSSSNSSSSSSSSSNMGESLERNGGLFPCQFETRPYTNHHYSKEPFLSFTCVTALLSLAVYLGITDDWTVPITLATLVSGFLLSENTKKKAQEGSGKLNPVNKA